MKKVVLSALMLFFLSTVSSLAASHPYDEASKSLPDMTGEN